MSLSCTPHPIAVDGVRLRRLLDAAGSVDGTESQGHGFVFQNAASSLLGLWVPDGYTSKWDAFASDPEVNSGVAPYSFKNVSIRGNVELGSLQRQTSVDEDFYLCVALWQSSKLDIVRIHCMRVPCDLWASLWPADVSPFLKDSVFDGISNSHADDAEWKSRRKLLQGQWLQARPAGSPMNWHAKRDHKKQLRVQCSIGKRGFSELFDRTYDHGLTFALESALDRS